MIRRFGHFLETTFALLFGLGILTLVALNNAGGLEGFQSFSGALQVVAAVAVGVGSWYIGRAFGSRRVLWGLCALPFVLTIEAHNIQKTVERDMRQRDAKESELRAAMSAREKVLARIEDASNKVANFPTTSPRLKRAQATKAEKEQAATIEIAKRHCAKECRQLHETMIAESSQEISAARAELTSQKETVTAELEAARATLAALPAPKKVNPFAERLGLSDTDYAILSATMLGIGVNGLAAMFIGFAAHRGRSEKPQETAKPKPQTLVSLPEGANEQVAAFFSENISNRKSEQLELEAVLSCYLAWASATGRTAMEPDTFGDAVRAIVVERGLELDVTDTAIAIHGIALKGPKLIAA